MFHFVWQSQFEHQKLVEQLTLQFPIVKKKKNFDYCKIEIQQNAEAENKFSSTCNHFTSFAHRNAV